MKKILLFITMLFLFSASLIGGSSYLTGSKDLLGTVLDNSTGLRWLKCPLEASGIPDTTRKCTGTPGAYTWSEAVAACDSLTFAGSSDWRLPAIHELQSISSLHYDSSPRINQKAFPNNGSRIYWSSTAYIGRSHDDVDNTAYAWSIDFTYGNPNPYEKTKYEEAGNDITIRCVMTPVP